VALVLTANKFVDPQSKLGAYRWYDRSLFARLTAFGNLPTAGNPEHGTHFLSNAGLSCAAQIDD